MYAFFFIVMAVEKFLSVPSITLKNKKYLKKHILFNIFIGIFSWISFNIPVYMRCIVPVISQFIFGTFSITKNPVRYFKYVNIFSLLVEITKMAIKCCFRILFIF